MKNNGTWSGNCGPVLEGIEKSAAVLNAELESCKASLVEANSYRAAFKLSEKANIKKEWEIETLKLGNDVLERELAINKTLLARQCDLAREAETRLEELRGKVRAYDKALDEGDLKEGCDAWESLLAAVEKGE